MDGAGVVGNQVVGSVEGRDPDVKSHSQNGGGRGRHREVSGPLLTTATTPVIPATCTAPAGAKEA